MSNLGVPPQAGSGHSRAEPEEVSAAVAASVPNAALVEELRALRTPAAVNGLERFTFASAKETAAYAEAAEAAFKLLPHIIEEFETCRLLIDTLGGADCIKDEASIGVGDGSGQLFVHGSYEAVKRVQAMVLEIEGRRP